jgi:hypothetical protein
MNLIGEKLETYTRRGAGQPQPRSVAYKPDKPNVYNGLTDERPFPKFYVELGQYFSTAKTADDDKHAIMLDRVATPLRQTIQRSKQAWIATQAPGYEPIPTEEQTWVWLVEAMDSTQVVNNLKAAQAIAMQNKNTYAAYQGYANRFAELQTEANNIPITILPATYRQTEPTLKSNFWNGLHEKLQKSALGIRTGPTYSDFATPVLEFIQQITAHALVYYENDISGASRAPKRPDSDRDNDGNGQGRRPPKKTRNQRQLTWDTTVDNLQASGQSSWNQEGGNYRQQPWRKKPKNQPSNSKGGKGKGKGSQGKGESQNGKGSKGAKGQGSGGKNGKGKGANKWQRPGKGEASATSQASINQMAASISEMQSNLSKLTKGKGGKKNKDE